MPMDVFNLMDRIPHFVLWLCDFTLHASSQYHAKPCQYQQA